MHQLPHKFPCCLHTSAPQWIASRISRQSLVDSPNIVQLLIVLLLVFIAGPIFFRYEPFTRPLRGDLGQFAYSSRMLAAGHPLYKNVFEIKTGLSFMLGGIAIRVGESIGIPSLIALRLLALSISIACVVLLYFLARMFLRATWAAFIAALIVIGFSGFAQITATGLEPKIVMLVFGLGALVLGARRQLFWAGVCAACAGLAWQLGWLYVPALFAVEWFDATRLRSEKKRALLFAFVGILIPLALYGFLFWMWDAWREMFVESLWLPLTLGRALPLWNIFARVEVMAHRFQTGYPYEILFLLVAILGWGMYLVRCVATRTLRQEFHTREKVGVLFAFHAFVIFALLDFQSWPDWIPLLPFLAIWCAWLSWFFAKQLSQQFHLERVAWSLPIVLIVLVAIVALYDVFLLPTKMRYTWQAQAALANKLEQQLTPDARIWFLGAPELLFFFNRPNANRYVLMTYHADAAMQMLEPRGFDGWLDALQTHPPQLIVLHRWRARNWAHRENAAALLNWMRGEYLPVPDCAEAGGAKFFVLSQAAAAFKNMACTTMR